MSLFACYVTFCVVSTYLAGIFARDFDVITGLVKIYFDWVKWWCPWSWCQFVFLIDGLDYV